jgi:hypothetical protein
MNSVPTPYTPPDLNAPPAAASGQSVLLQVISRVAGDPSIDLDRVERLLVMHAKLSEKDAENQFISAMAQFKRHAPKILKMKAVAFNGVAYKHATLGQVCAVAIEGLGAVGISHRWDLDQQQGGRIKVTCVLTHVAGHSTRTELSGSPDDSGKKNNIQQVASTITYLERYTLLAATGLATDEQDDDGAGAGKQPATEAQDAPEGYENWAADIEQLDNEPELRTAWAGSPAKFRDWATGPDARWWTTRKASAAAGLTFQAFIRQQEG